MRLTILLLSLCCAVSAWGAQALQPVRLQLKWTHQFQFAGYYAAQAQGFYREAGLAVSFLEARPGQDPVAAVLNGQAEFGVGTSDLLLYRARGLPVVVLGVIFQHSPLALLALDASGIRNIHQVVGRRLMIEDNSAELFAYLEREGIPRGSLNLVAHSFGTAELSAGTVDAQSVYITDEPFVFAQAGVNYSLFTPRSGGIDFYGDNLFTTQSYLRANPGLVAAFREASLRGWVYAMAHPQEVADLIITR
ncbi:ABC transporter substrate-binding protein [uncultured Thiodictyon sp.]|uniref:ABC transporter substrate-binding protein n=1 Tax=uncultured Thiodictyon sp. TaxID=1846217 RepID=UPI0025F59E3B|nr:ABC transporter substrate-binding protein [uncultured Thiodictyon sp.]